jgi:hypothetical protein
LVGKKQTAGFFSLEGISKSRGDVAESTQNNIKLLLENNYLVN